MRGWKRIVALAAVAAMLGGRAADAATYYYFRGGAQTSQQTGPKPASPAPAGTFAILIDADNPAIQGNPFYGTVYAYSNVGTVAFSVKSGALPAGVSINPATGTISGTPTTLESTSAVIEGVDSANGNVATATLTLDTVAPLSISGTPALDVVVGAAYSATFTLAGGSQPYGFSVSGLPSGLAMTTGPTSATLAGSPAAAGSFNIVVTGTEAHGLYAQYPYTLTVAAPLAVSGTPPATATVGTAYAGQVAISGGAPPYAFSLVAGSLPNGLTLKSTTGVVSGTPTTAGGRNGIQIKVTDAAGQSALSPAFSITVAGGGSQPLSVAGNPPTTATVNQSYVGQFTAGGGSGSYKFSLAAGSGALPGGLSLNTTTGLISGAPLSSAVGSFANITVEVADGGGNTATATPFTITVSPPTAPLAIAGNPPTTAQAQTPYVAQFAASGGTGTGYTYSSNGSALPAGLSIDPASGILSGSPTTAGTYSGLRIHVVDSGGNAANTATFIITVSPPAPLAISGSPSATAAQGQAYSATWTAFDGSGAGYHFTSVGAPLPPGLSVSDINGAQGLLSGSPTTAGTYSGLQIQVQDSANNTAVTAAFSITVASSLAVTGSPASGGQVGTPYSAQFNASGGSGSGYSYASTGGALPTGLTLDTATGAITGTPTVAGAFGGLQIQATDSAGATALSQQFAIDIAPPAPPPQQALAISGSPATATAVGESYSAQFTASGGSGSYSFSLAAGTLPSGLSLDAATGLISGTPSAVGTSSGLQVQVSDTASDTALSATFSITVASNLAIAGSPQISVIAGQAYSAQFTASGGSGGGYAYSVSGTLPAGITMDAATGLISGTASTVGTYSGLAAVVTDSFGYSASSAPFSITVQPSISIAGNPSGTATVGYAYGAGFTASGGSGGYVYSAVGTLPGGITLNTASGLLSGTPTAAGTFPGLQIKVTDAAGASAGYGPFTIVASYPALNVLGTPASSVQEGSAYSAQFTASGGSGGGYSYALATGTLPAGLSLNSATGLLSGTVPYGAAGTYGGLSLSATDSAGNSGLSETFSITVTALPALTVSGNPPASVVAGQSYSAQFTASGGAGGYTFSLAGAALPSGLSLNTSTGLISGSPGAVGSYSGLQVEVTDKAGRTAVSAAFTLTVTSNLAITATPQTSVVASNQAYSTQFTASGGTGGYAFSVAGNLPSGISMNAATGLLSGTTTATVGTYAGITAQVVDSSGAAASFGPFSITVTGALALSGNPNGTATSGTSYFAQFAASGGTQPYAFTASGLPAGLSIDPAGGAISGVPSSAGNFNVTVSVTDANQATQSLSYALDVVAAAQAPLTISWAPQTYWNPGNFMAEAVTVSGGNGNPYTFGYTGTLPPGISQDPSTGALTGTLSTAGTYGPIAITVTDGTSNATTSPGVTFVVTSNAQLAISWKPPAGPFNVGDYVYSNTTVTGGNSANYHFSVSGTLPPNMGLGGGGNICCNPANGGAFGPITVTVTDGQQTATTTPWSFIVNPPLPLAVTYDTPVRSGTVGASYTENFGGSGGAKTGYQCALAANSAAPPPGVKQNGCSLSGVPTTAGTYAGIVLQVTDYNGTVADSAPISITISPMQPLAISWNPTTTYYIGQFFDAQTTTTGGWASSYAYSFSGPLPPGSGGNSSNGGICCNVTTPGTYGPVTVTVTDGGHSPAATTSPVTFTVLPMGLTGSFPNGIVGQSYRGSLTTLGGFGGINFSCTGLPAGLVQSGAGIYGTPAAGSGGTYTVNCTATDSQSHVATYSTSFSIEATPPTLAANIADAHVGEPYSFTLAASGGKPPYTYALDPRSQSPLPPGLTLSAAGVISGTPITKGGYTVDIDVTDAAGQTASTGNVVFNVYQDDLTISGTIDYDFMVSRWPWQSFDSHNGMFTAPAAQGGTTWRVIGLTPAQGAAFFGTQTPDAFGRYSFGGNLPPPAAPATATFSIEVVDGNHNRGVTGPYTVTAWPNLVLAATPAPPHSYVNYPYFFQMQVTGGKPQVTCTGGVPAGLTVDPVTCTISGTPTVYDTSFGQDFTATDASGYTSTVIWNVGMVPTGLCADGATFTVPAAYTTLTIRVWGGGGASTAVQGFNGATVWLGLGGNAGGPSRVTGPGVDMYASGGFGAPADGWGGGTSGTSGGTAFAIGGNVWNIPGTDGGTGEPNSAAPGGMATGAGATAPGPGGGVGGASSPFGFGGGVVGLAGSIPGGGASGAGGAWAPPQAGYTIVAGGGGQSGSFVESIFTPDKLPGGSVLSCSVGKGGTVGVPDGVGTYVTYPAAAGADGQIQIVVQ